MKQIENSLNRFGFTALISGKGVVPATGNPGCFMFIDLGAKCFPSGFLILIMNRETVVAMIAERAGNLKGVVLAAVLLQWLLLIAVMKGPLCTE